MHPFRGIAVIAAIAGSGLALMPGAALPAAGPTAQQESLSTMLARLAPLALSEDGAWIVFLDADNVLHRQDMRDPARGQRMPMPRGIVTLAASRAGERVAFTAGWGCAGWVDFGTAAPSGPVLHWAPGITPRLPAPEQFGAGTPGVPVCQEALTPALALSGDGRRLATAAQVVDLDTGTVLASLPPASATLRLQFADQDRKLLMATAILGDEGYGDVYPNALQFSVWDLKTKALRRLVSDATTTLNGQQLFFHDFSARTTTLARVVRRPGKGPVTFDIMQQPLGACRSRPAVQFSFAAFDWQSMLMDPHGRWIAAIRSLKNAHRTGFVEELTVYDLASRRPVSTLRSQQPLRGLVAAPDGATVYALASAVHDDSGEPSFDRGGTLVSHAVNVAALRGAKRAPVAWDEAPCRIEDETASARALPAPDPQQLLPLRWTVPLPAAAIDGAQDGDDRRHADVTRLPCTTVTGAAMSGVDWRASHFGSSRAYDCDAPPGARTVYWHGLDIAPVDGAGQKPVAWPALGDTGAIGVAIEGGRLHVHDAVARRVLGQIDTADAGTITGISIDAGAGLVLVESEAMRDGAVTRALRAYSYRGENTAQ